MHVIAGALIGLGVLAWLLLRSETQRESRLPVVPPHQRAEDDALLGCAAPDVPSIAGRWRP